MSKTSPLLDIDRAARSLARARAMRKPGADFLLQRALEDLDDRLAATTRSFARCLCTGPHAGEVADRLTRNGRIGAVTVDPAGHGETLSAAPGDHDLAVSLYQLHQANDVVGLLVQHRLALAPDGLFLGCAAGAGTLGELRECLIEAEASAGSGVHARVLPFMDVRDAGALLQRAGFALPVTDVDSVSVRHATTFDLMHDLRAMGQTSSLAARPRGLASRTLFARAASLHAQRHGDADGRVRSTFTTVWMSGWAPGAGQPKALRPGSATVSLADVLGSGRKEP